MKLLNLTLKIWRQGSPAEKGELRTYDMPGVSDEMSFLEMLDILNDRLTAEGEEPIAFEHDCREGICGSCAMMINGRAHGPERGTATCQLHMRKFEDGEALRHDDQFAYAAAWGWTGSSAAPEVHKEALEFEYVKLAQRSYK